MSHLPTPEGPPPIQLVKENLAYSNRFVAVYDDEVRIGGDPGTYLRIIEGDGGPGVACIPRWRDHIGLVLVYRYPVGRWEWAIPRGFASHEDPIDSLLAEAREELGAEPSSVTEVGRIATNSGLLAGEVVIYVGSWESKDGDPADRREVHSVSWLRQEDLDVEIRNGQITDAVTLAALTLARAKGLI